MLCSLPCAGGVVSPVLFSHDGKMAVTVNADDVRTWDMPAGTLRACFNLQTLLVHSVSFSPDDHYLLTAGDDKIARVWNAQIKNAPAIVQDSKFVGALDKPVISPDSRMLIASTEDNGAEIYDLASGRKTVLAHSTKPDIRCVNFAPDSRLVAAADGSSAVTIWDVPEQQSGALTGSP